jgi:hypothetical protein
MRRAQAVCANCAGIGHKVVWEIDSEDTETSTGTATRKVITCEVCNGKRYIEHAVFSVEEAEAILKHCGFNIEN